MIEHCCDILSASLDGRYGWQDEVITIVAVLVIFNFLARWILSHLHKRFEKQKKIWLSSFVKALYAPLIFYTWFFAFVHATNLILPQLVSEDFYSYMHMLLSATAVVAVAWFIMRWKKLLFQLLSQKISKHEIAMEQTKLDVVNKLITIFVIFLTILLILEVTNRSVSTLIAFGGVGGLALAFASQEIIANYFSSVMIYTTKPFSVGDWILVPEKNIEGYVEEIGWYMTRIRTFEKRPVYIPNSLFSKMVVETPSRMSHRKFIEILNLRYQDLSKIKSIIVDIEKMLETHPAIDLDQKNMAYLSNLGVYSIQIEVSAFTGITDSEDFALLKQDLLYKILDIVKKHEAEIAYPVTTMVMNKE